MTYSRRKPYQRQGYGIREFYRAPVRHLKDSIGPESVFEKPYQTSEYGDMQQSPNTPEIPGDPGGDTGLVCIYNPDDCAVFGGCYAGSQIKIDGGPEEVDAGYIDPKVLEGVLISWSIGDDPREINFEFDDTVDKNVVEITFVDGWGVKHTEVLDSTCIEEAATPTLPEISDSEELGWGDFTYIGCDYPCVTFVADGGALLTNAGYSSFIRFSNITANQGQTINSASLKVNRTIAGAAESVYIIGVDADNISAPRNASDLSDLHLCAAITTAYITFPISSGTGEKTSPDFKTVLQEIVSRPGWSNGNAIILHIWSGITGSSVTLSGFGANQPVLTWD